MTLLYIRAHSREELILCSAVEGVGTLIRLHSVRIGLIFK